MKSMKWITLILSCAGVYSLFERSHGNVKHISDQKSTTFVIRKNWA